MIINRDINIVGLPIYNAVLEAINTLFIFKMAKKYLYCIKSIKFKK